MKKIVVLISGRGSNFVAIEECALREDWEHTIDAKIVAVISNRPDAKGLELAKGYGMDALCVDHKAFETREAFEEKLYEVISQYSPDLIVLAGFMRILTAGFVDRRRLTAARSLRRLRFPFCQATMSIDWQTVCFGMSIRFTPAP